jgi:hypothetical protein
MPLVDWRDWLEVGGRGTWEKQKKRRHQPNPKARATFKQIPGSAGVAEFDVGKAQVPRG